MQGCARCELFGFFACGRARLGEKSAERKQVVCGFFMPWPKPRPTKNFGRNVKTRTLQKPKSAAPAKDKCSRQEIGRIGHPPCRMWNRSKSSRKSKPAPFKKRRVRHPEKISVQFGPVKGLATRREDCIYFLS